MHTCEVIKNTFEENIAIERQNTFCRTACVLGKSVCATDNCIEDYVEETNRCIV